MVFFNFKVLLKLKSWCRARMTWWTRRKKHKTERHFLSLLNHFTGILLDIDYHSLTLLWEPCLISLKSCSNFFDLSQLFHLVFKSFLLSSWILSLLHNSVFISWDITFHLGVCLSTCIWMKLPLKNWPTTDSPPVPDLCLSHTGPDNLKFCGHPPVKLHM